MSIVKTNQKSTFSHIHRGAPFVANLTLYTRSDGNEDPKDYVFYKTGKNRAVTVDKRTVVHFLPNAKIILCTMENKKAS